MIDTRAIRERVDLLALVGADTHLGKVAAAEWAGACPKCGGRDRVHVTAEWWMCRQCHEKRGDAIEYLCWRDGLTFAEACAALGQVSTHVDNPARSVSHGTPEPAEAPPAEWQERARRFVAWAGAHLGYNPAQIWRRDVWQHEGRAVKVAAGWVIPCEMGEALWYVKIRQPAGVTPRYLAVRGSRKAGVVYGLDWIGCASDLIICEGEINALTLAQELGTVGPAVVSVGDSGNVPGLEALAAMATVRRWWLMFDPDKAGEHGRDKLAAAYARARVLNWPHDVDLNAAHLQGVDLRTWALVEIEARTTPSPVKQTETGPEPQYTARMPHASDGPQEPDYLAGAWDPPEDVGEPEPGLLQDTPKLNALGEIRDCSPWWAGGPGVEQWRIVPAPWWAPPEGAYPRTWWHNAQADAWQSVT
jgi:DNA primase